MGIFDFRIVSRPQVDRASGNEPKGRMFESCRAHQSNQSFKIRQLTTLFAECHIDRAAYRH